MSFLVEPVRCSYRGAADRAHGALSELLVRSGVHLMSAIWLLRSGDCFGTRLLAQVCIVSDDPHDTCAV